MKRDFLKSLGLEGDVIDKIMDEAGKDINKLKVENEKANEELEALKGELKETSTTLKGLKKNNADNEELQKTIKDHEETIKQLKIESETKIKNLKVDNAINDILTKNKAKHSDLLKGKFDRESLVINEDGTLSGLDDQFKSIKDTYKDLFEEKIQGVEPVNNVSAVGQTEEDAALKEFDKYFNL